MFSNANLLKKFYRNWFYVLAVVLLIQFAGSCEKDKKINALNSVISNLDIEKQKFITETNKKNEQITSQAQIIISQKQTSYIDYFS